jgi:hypothetical protein
LGQGWGVGDFGQIQSSNALKSLIFNANDNHFRNDGVTCSSHVSGTTFFKVLSQGKSSASCQRAIALKGPFCLLKGLKLDLTHAQPGRALPLSLRFIDLDGLSAGREWVN